jgi:hypothetical protein
VRVVGVDAENEDAAVVVVGEGGDVISERS